MANVIDASIIKATSYAINSEIGSLSLSEQATFSKTINIMVEREKTVLVEMEKTKQLELLKDLYENAPPGQPKEVVLALIQEHMKKPE